MRILDEITEREIDKNKAIRGYIVRSLMNGFQYSLLVRQLTNSLLADSLIVSPDISKYLDYLVEAGYVSFTDKTANAYNAYRRDTVVKLTRKGIDLAENTIEDAGVDV